MFDSSSLPEPAALHAVGDAELIEAIEGWNRTAAAADARRLAAIAELSRRRCEDDDDERQWWVCDPTTAAAAEVAAALNIGQGKGLGQLRLAVWLRDQCPKVNALFVAGSITYAMVNTLRWRTMLVSDDVMGLVDARLAGSVVEWGPLSVDKLVTTIDAVIEELDPDAVRRLQTATRGRDVWFGDPDDATGTTSMGGRLLASDAALLKERVERMARGVCAEDPRNLGQRRSDALGAVGAGADHLACRCGSPECPAADDDRRGSSFVMHIVADPSALTTQPDPGLHGDYPGMPTTEEKAEGETESAEPEPEAEAEPAPVVGEPAPASTPEPEPTPATVAEPESAPVGESGSAPDSPAPAAASRRPTAGVILGGGVLPPALLAELIALGATVRFVTDPAAEAEPRYRPSAKLAEYIRIRDLTCRFPGCDRPAYTADIDHTMPWPAGATHPADLKCYCRIHHLLKTHWSGDGGWTDRQYPDGTVEVTTPASKTYTTKPGATLLFPGWNITTTDAPPTGSPTPPADHSGLAMPKRKRTRAQQHASRIKAEREHNAVLTALAQAAKSLARQPNQRETTHPTGDDDPPPF
jgi:hypothetical protein